MCYAINPYIPQRKLITVLFISNAANGEKKNRHKMKQKKGVVLSP